MNPQTAELVRALGAVNQHVPRIISELLTNDLSPAKQHEFASLLVELGHLLHQYADDQTAGYVLAGNSTVTATQHTLGEGSAGRSEDEPPPP